MVTKLWFQFSVKFNWLSLNVLVAKHFSGLKGQYIVVLFLRLEILALQVYSVFSRFFCR